MSKARKYLLDDKIDFDDFSKLKEEQTKVLGQLNLRLNNINQKLAKCDQSDNYWPDTELGIFQSYKEQDIKGKRDILSLFTPTAINPVTLSIDSLSIDEVISQVVEYRK